MLLDIGQPADGTRLFDTPEEAALDGWRSTRTARPRVVSVQPSTYYLNGLRVTIETGGLTESTYQEVTNCVQAPDGRWFTAGSFGI